MRYFGQAEAQPAVSCSGVEWRAAPAANATVGACGGKPIGGRGRGGGMERAGRRGRWGRRWGRSGAAATTTAAAAAAGERRSPPATTSVQSRVGNDGDGGGVYDGDDGGSARGEGGGGGGGGGGEVGDMALAGRRLLLAAALVAAALVAAAATSDSSGLEFYIAGEQVEEKWIYVDSPRCCSDCTYVSRGWKCKEKTCLLNCPWIVSAASSTRPPF
ncbi:hypothetical protein R5R35_002437 [Gryllus longicercus]|uniref:Uncharacterized protein n=1 Tax=Gryllus longicercus TaxID=2509291 RepID=A0AAN9Z0U7_9ORTH